MIDSTQRGKGPLLPAPAPLIPARRSLGIWCFVLPTSLLLALPAAAQAEAEAAAAEGSEAGAAPKDEVVITEKARQHFRAGVNFLQDPDGARYEEAYDQFKAAYSESPSWKILSNLGISAMKLERDGEAIDAFEKYLAEGGALISEDERAQTERDLQTLKAGVVQITLTANVPGVRIVDQRVTNSGGSIVNQYALAEGQLVLRVRPGTHRIKASASGYEDSEWEVNASAASSHEHAFELVEPKAAGGSGGTGAEDGGTYRPVPTTVWIGLGVTGALTVGAVITGSIALGKNSEYDDANAERDPDADDMRKGVKSMNLVTDVLIGGAVVAGAVTTILYVTRPTVRKESAFRVEPLVGTSGGFVRLTGKF